MCDENRVRYAAFGAALSDRSIAKMIPRGSMMH
jgi:hypothetical protein